jgi:hypothetical protein
MDVFSFASSFAHFVGALQLDDSSIALIALLGGMYGGYWLNGRHEQLKAKRAKIPSSAQQQKRLD